MQEDPEDYNGILEAFLQEYYDFSGWGILLTGTDRCSSQAAAMKVLELLVEQGCEGVFLDGADLGEGGGTQAKAKLNGLLDKFYDMGTGLCLVLEGMEESACRWEILNFLGKRLCEYWLYKEEFPPLFLILIDEREKEIPNLLRDRLKLCRTNNPNYAQRAIYLKKHAVSLKDCLSLTQFAQLTEGADYAQLRDMIAMAGWLVDSRDGRGLTDEELSELLEGQMPTPSKEMASQSLYQSIQQLAERLPQALNGVTVGQMVPQALPAASASPAAAVPQDQGKYLASKRKEIEEMAPKQLIHEVLDDDFLKEVEMRCGIPQ